jgi:transcriptional regulator GlxA family with amidase domain
MQIAVLTFEGFNELDSFVPAAVLNRLSGDGWKAWITAPARQVISMNGVAVQAQRPIEFAREADAVIIGSGSLARELADDEALMGRLALDPGRQLIGAQCSGALVAARLGLLRGRPACTDLPTRPWLRAAGVQTLDQPFVAHGNVATAGGGLAAVYLAAWLMWRLAGEAATRTALHAVAPVGEKLLFVERAVSLVSRYALARAAA